MLHYYIILLQFTTQCQAWRKLWACPRRRSPDNISLSLSIYIYIYILLNIISVYIYIYIYIYIHMYTYTSLRRVLAPTSEPLADACPSCLPIIIITTTTCLSLLLLLPFITIVIITMRYHQRRPGHASEPRPGLCGPLR